jgi:hypothetical protein
MEAKRSTAIASLRSELSAQLELVHPLARLCLQLTAAHVEELDAETRMIERGLESKPESCSDHLVALAQLLLGVCDLLTPQTDGGVLDPALCRAVEEELSAQQPEAVALLERSFSLEDGMENPFSISTAAFVLAAADCKSSLAAADVPERWRVAEALAAYNDDESTSEAEFSPEQIVGILASRLNEEFADFEDECAPMLAESRRRIEARVGALLKEPILIVNTHPDAHLLWSERAQKAYGFRFAATANKETGLIVFSRSSAARLLEAQEQGRIDTVLPHELIHLAQPLDLEGRAEAASESPDYEPSGLFSPEGLGRTALLEGVTEALTKRLVEDRTSGFASPRELDTTYEAEAALVEKLAAHFGGALEQEAFISRLARQSRHGLLPQLAREFGRPALSDETLRQTGRLFDDLYDRKPPEARVFREAYLEWVEETATALAAGIVAGDYDAAPVLEPIDDSAASVPSPVEAVEITL